MNYRPLGSTGLRVSEIGFGCGNVGGLMIRGEPGDRVKAAARAMELGINYFDTAPSYGNYQSETNLGAVLKELGADVYVGTKVRPTTEGGQTLGESVMRSVEESLTRLGLEYVDLIQLHNHITWSSGAARGSLSAEDVLEEVVGALQTLKAQGKVRNYGFTGVGETGALQHVVDSGALNTMQSCYNLLNPSAGHHVPPGYYSQDFERLIDRASDRGMGVLVIRVLAAGVLGGEEGRHPVAAPTVTPIGSGRDREEDEIKVPAFDLLLQEGFEGGLAEASIRFALSNDAVSTVLVGYSSMEQMESSVAFASRGPLGPLTLEGLTQVWSQFVTA